MQKRDTSISCNQSNHQLVNGMVAANRGVPCGSKNMDYDVIAAKIKSKAKNRGP